MKFDKKKFKETIEESNSYMEVCMSLWGYVNSVKINFVKKNISELDIDISHFDRGISKRRKYEVVEKICPVCQNKFETKKGHPREKTVCSRACSNTFFRSNENHPNWKNDAYRTTCFQYHEKECVICKEKNIVEVHHFDKNKNNNNPDNLIPICPTHHKYCHSRYYKLIRKKIEKYRDNFIKKQKQLVVVELG